MDGINDLEDLTASKTSTFAIKDWQHKCYEAMNDDFNTPILIANLFDAVKFINQIKEGNATISQDDLNILKATFHTFAFDILGLVNVNKSENGTEKLSGAVELLIQLRQDARANKDFATSDKIRDELAAAGIQLNDGKEGTTFTTN